ncbi:MAG: ComEC/Rec2 family competence protein [Akkermansia sp.]|nr:ComEC/Rec2 family competence protein [Akkermansia sp.]
MKRLRRWVQGAPLFLPLVAVCGAIAGSWWWSLAVVAVLVALGCRLWRIAICTLLCAAVAGLHALRLEEKVHEFCEQAEQNEVVELRGTVERTLRRGCVLSTGWGGVRVVLRGNTLYTPGDLVQVRAQWTAPRPAGVRGVFDSAAWMLGQGIAASLDIVESQKLEKPLSLRTIQHWGLCIREKLAQRLMPPGVQQDPARQVLCALVLGDKSGAEAETMEDFRNGGCLHAFAVSGLHVGLVSGILWSLLRVLRVRPVVIRPLLLVSVGMYVLMTGCAVPAIRAYVMLAVLLLGHILQRRVSLLNTWSFAALVLLVPEPCQLYNAGFLLSFGVYAAICLATRLCTREKPWFGPDDYIPVSLRTRGEMRWSYAELALRGDVIVSLSAWLVSVPVMLYFFHSANTSSFLTNIAITPILPIVMFLGLLCLCTAGIPWLGGACALLAQKSAALLLAVVAWFGELPYAYLPAQPPAPEHSLLVQGTGYGGCFTMLGNHGLLIDCGNEATAELTTVPALFHAGYKPAALLLTSSRVRDGGGAAVLQRMWPQLPVIRAAELPAEGLVLETQAGRFSVYPDTRSHTPGQPPVVVWESPAGRVLYIGNASYTASQPFMETKADVIVLGEHPRQPVQMSDIDAARVLLLPGVHNDSALRDGDFIQLMLPSDK